MVVTTVAPGLWHRSRPPHPARVRDDRDTLFEWDETMTIGM
jgi:hypothetical protein